MENIHPAAINPKVNKKKYMNKIREKYGIIDTNEKRIVGGNENLDEVNSNNEVDIKDNERKSNYMYIGGLVTMVGQLGVMLYWFIKS
jgi:hypothetical protein